jgi:hypothetical protein
MLKDVNIELFTDTIQDSVYKRVSTGIENVVKLNGSFDSFKKESKLNNFDKDMFDKLVEKRNKEKQKLRKIDMQLVFSGAGRDKVMESIKE